MFDAAFDWQPILLSLQVAGGALVLAFFIGVAAAHIFSSRHIPLGGLVEAILLLPLVLPPVVTGYALLVLLGHNGALGAWLERHFHLQILFTPTAAVLASAVVALPLTFTSARAAFRSLDVHSLEAARCLGANNSRVFWSIVLPLSWPGLVAGGVLAFARGLGEFGATIMVAGNIAGQTTTAPVAIYMAVEGGDFHQASQYVLLLAGMNFVFLLFVNVWMTRVVAVRHSN